MLPLQNLHHTPFFFPLAFSLLCPKSQSHLVLREITSVSISLVRNSLNPGIRAIGRCFSPDTTYRYEQVVESVLYQVYPKMAAHHARRRKDIDFTNHLRIQPHVPTPRQACPLCSHFHSSVIAVAVLCYCHDHPSIDVITCGLECLNFEYHATSNQVLPRCDISTSHDRGVGAGL